jgi:uncharacterized protein (UPF0261 family)
MSAVAAATPTVVLVGSLDTKGAEYAFVRERLRSAGVNVLLVDTGVLGSPTVVPDVARDEVAAAANEDVDALARARDRGRAVAAMARGARQIVVDLHGKGLVQGVLGLGGTGGTTLCGEVFRALPLGVPKVIVSTAASGDTRPYVGESDLVLYPSVTDVAGINRLSVRILANAAAAVAGMVSAPVPSPPDDRPLVGASMFGVTTPCVDAGRARLEQAGYEVLVFHMTGAGGRTLEQLIADGWLSGVLDVTSTELADELVGGVFSAGPNRLTAAGKVGIPQVVSVGALDMVNFGPRDTVPSRFRGRLLYEHNASVTLMRTTPEECAELGRRLAERLSAGTAPTAVFLPLRGTSAIAVEGGPFHDPTADAALFAAIRANLGSRVELVELDLAINDPEFASAMADALLDYMATASRNAD